MDVKHPHLPLPGGLFRVFAQLSGRSYCKTRVNADERRLAEAFDMQLLTLLGEETFETEDENELLKAVSAAIGATFCAAQLRLANGPIAPLVRFAASRARAVVRRVPDRDLRQVYVRTGLSLSGCETALQAAQTVNALIEADPELLGVGRWPELLVALARAAMTVVEAAEAGSGAGIEPGAVPQLVRDWVAGMPIDELRHAHEAHLRINDPMKFATSVDRVVVNTLSWVISSVVQLIQHLRNEPLVGPMTFASAMVKFGVDSAPACYAASMGVRRRSDAQAIAALCPLEAASSLPGFLRWVSGLAPADLRGHVSDATIAMFTEKAAASQSPPELCEIAVIGSGAVTVPLRGIAHAGSAGSVNALADSGALSIRRDASNSADPNAIEVLTQEGRERLGYVAREAARVIAPLMDLGDGVSVTAALASRPDPTGSTLSDVEDHDAVSIRITVVDDGDPTYRQAR